MAQTMASLQNHFRGVSCSRCRQPIPISLTIGNLEGELHAFALRCRVCEEEGIYTILDIQSFHGEPARRQLNTLTSIRSRAAKG